MKHLLENVYWVIVKNYENPEHTVCYVIDDFTLYKSSDKAIKKLEEIFNQFFKKIGTWHDGDLPHFEVMFGKTKVTWHITSMLKE